MLRRSKKQKKKAFSTIDIETNKEGELLALASYNGEEIKTFLSWGEYLQFLQENNHQECYRNIFAHYGGGFDYVHFLESALWEIHDVKVITAGSDIIMIHLFDFDKQVVFADSIKVLLSGLKKLGETFEIEDKKKDIDINEIEKIFNEQKELFFEYLHGDVIALYQIMQKFMSLIEITHFPVTAASLAMQIFKERYLPEDVCLFKSGFKPENELDKFISLSYAGGRVECFKPGPHDNVKVFDINSLYPSVMAVAAIPDCAPVYIDVYANGEIGFYEIEFEQFNISVPPVLWIKTYETGLEFVYKGQGVFCSIEIDKALEVGTRIKVIKGIFYPRTASVFYEYVTKLYELRNENKGGPLDYICKLLLNSLYGKFAQREKSTTLQKIPRDKLKLMLDCGEEITPYDEEKELYTVGENREIAHRLIHVASIITAMARVKLYSFIQRYANNLIYCDTDSVHITCDMEPEFLGTELGAMKLEDSGHGVYIGRKMYAIGKKVKFKGVNLKDRLADEIAAIMTPSDLEAIWNGEELSFSYHTFPKLRGVLKGEKAAKKKRITKKLKPGNYFTNFGK